VQTGSENRLMFALFGVGGGEIILILALILILVGARKIPEIARGLGQGISKFRDALDGGANDAGRSVGGIYGKPAAQALTPDNEVAELYDPAIFRRARNRKRGRRLVKWLVQLWLWIRRHVVK
jgi:TatA/E family protein of Tat protein translocase